MMSGTNSGFGSGGTPVCTFREAAVFRGAVFRGAVFRGAVFRGAVFRGAVFGMAVFREALFREALFREALFREALFGVAVLRVVPAGVVSPERAPLLRGFTELSTEFSTWAGNLTEVSARVCT
jgi:uncharacterized protein YjbI with pentapeptide repeats